MSFIAPSFHLKEIKQATTAPQRVDWRVHKQFTLCVRCILALTVVTTTKLQFKTHIKLQHQLEGDCLQQKKKKNSPSLLMTCNWTSWTVCFIFFLSHSLWRLFKVSSSLVGSLLVSGAVAHCKVSYQAGSWLMRTKLQMFKWAENEKWMWVKEISELEQPSGVCRHSIYCAQASVCPSNDETRRANDICRKSTTEHYSFFIFPSPVNRRPSWSEWTIKLK